MGLAPPPFQPSVTVASLNMFEPNVQPNTPLVKERRPKPPPQTKIVMSRELMQKRLNQQNHRRVPISIVRRLGTGQNH